MLAKSTWSTDELLLTQSQTDGSILSPSDVNNLVGIKPTVGLTSRYLVIPISQHQDTVGPMARTVKDAAYLLQAVAGPGGQYDNDNYTQANPNKNHLPDYVAACNFSALRGARFGVARNLIELFSDNSSGPVLQAFNAAIKTIKAAGATVVDANFTALSEWAVSNNESIVLETDFINDLAHYLSELTYNSNNIHSLAQLANFTEKFPAEDYPERDIGVWQSALQLGYNASDYRAYKARQADLYLGGPGGILGALQRLKLNAVLLPTQFASPFPAIVGSPVVTVPMGFYPANETVVMNGFGNLVAIGPRIP